MALFTWKPEYSVNHPDLDSHHMRLFDVINTAYENVMTSGEKCIIPNFDELEQYTRYHFVAEEKHMRETWHHDFAGHIAEHRLFIKNIEDLKSGKGNNLETSQELIIMLGQWLIHHVLSEDKKYATA